MVVKTFYYHQKIDFPNEGEVISKNILVASDLIDVADVIYPLIIADRHTIHLKDHVTLVTIHDGSSNDVKEITLIFATDGQEIYGELGKDLKYINCIRIDDRLIFVYLKR